MGLMIKFEFLEILIQECKILPQRPDSRASNLIRTDRMEKSDSSKVRLLDPPCPLYSHYWLSDKRLNLSWFVNGGREIAIYRRPNPAHSEPHEFLEESARAPLLLCHRISQTPIEIRSQLRLYRTTYKWSFQVPRSDPERLLIGTPLNNN